MTEQTLDELGPVDYLIVEFPAGHQNFTGEGADELVKLHDAGIIRIMDILILTKDANGAVDAMELSDLGELGELERLEAQLVQTLAEEDVVNLAVAIDPGSVAAVLVYENVWAAPFGSAMRRAGGRLIANGRISHPGPHRRGRGRRGPQIGRRLTCRSVPGRAGRGASSALPSPRLLSSPSPGPSPVAKAAVIASPGPSPVAKAAVIASPGAAASDHRKADPPSIQGEP